MLVGLDAVDWGSLCSTSGDSAHIPVLIRNLMTKDPLRFRRTSQKLINEICPQGSSMQVAPHVVPFLFELIENEDVISRDSIIALLVTIAIGLDSDYLPYKFDPRRFREEWVQRCAKIPAKKQEASPFGACVQLRSYDAVQERSGLLKSLLHDRSERVRCASAFAVCWFPGMEDVHSHLGGALCNPDSLSVAEAVNYLLAYGLIGFHHKLSVEFDLLSEFLRAGDMLVRSSAAIALAQSFFGVNSVFKLLVEAAESVELDNVHDVTFFNEGDLTCYAAKIIRDLGK